MATLLLPGLLLAGVCLSSSQTDPPDGPAASKTSPKPGQSPSEGDAPATPPQSEKKPEGPPAPSISGFIDSTGTIGGATTGDSRITLFGTAQKGTTVTIRFNEELQGTTPPVRTGGFWALKTPRKPAGIYTITATSTDQAGRTSPRSPELEVEIEPGVSSLLVGFLLLIPAFIALLARSLAEFRPQKSFRWKFWKLGAGGPSRTHTNATDHAMPEAAQEPAADADRNPGMIFIIVASWALVLGVLGLLQDEHSQEFGFFHSGLSFPLFVPVLGLLGAMIFIIDVFRKGRMQEDVDVGKEYAWRLLLGPYVAIVMVLLAARWLQSDAHGTYEGLRSLEKQAVMAFFSGFLVVFALQWLVEIGHTSLGVTRDKFRYVPSEIAVELGLDKGDDLKLQKAKIKRLDQLAELEDKTKQDQLVRLAGLEEHFLASIIARWPAVALKQKMGKRIWKLLRGKGVTGIRDVAGLSEELLVAYADELKLDGEHFKRFWKQCQSFVFGASSCNDDADDQSDNGED